MEAKTLFRQLLPSPSGRIIAMLILLLTISGTSVAAEKEAYAMKKYYSATSYSDSYYTLTFYYDDLRSTRGDETYDLNTGNDNPGWIGWSNGKYKSVTIDPSFVDARPTSTYKWFYDMSKISEITGIEFLNTSEVTDMGRMFHGCSKLSSLNVSGFNTENVTSMFCIFTECSNLTSLDLSSFNTANVKDMSYMFSDCSSLTTIYASGGWVTTNVISSTEMLSGCTELKGFAGTAYDSRHVEKEYAHFDGGTANPGYLTPKGRFPYAVYTPSNNTLTFYSDDQIASRSGTAYYLNNGSATPAWSEHSPLIFHVVYDASFDEARPESTSHWFHNLTNLQDITGTQYLHTDYVTDMSYMFSGCRLTSLDLSRFNTEKVTNMQNMFASCSELTSLDLSSFNTASVKNMSYMLYGCANLESLDVSSFNTVLVTNINRMFSDCSSLACIDLRSFNTKQVTAMTGMFYSCSALASILAATTGARTP